MMDGAEYHILAYDINTQDRPLNDLLKYNRDVLADMGNKLIEKVSEDYESVSMEEFSKYERDLRNGGWNSIDYLKSKGIVASVPEYFKLAQKYSVSLEKDFFCASKVIEIIHNAAGYAVLAHLGYSTGQNLAACKEAAAQFLAMGIDGFECYYPTHTDEITGFLVNFCRERDLIITAGSDEHGGFNGENYYIGAVKIKIEQLNLKTLI
jgi:hypothetical protein